MKSIWYWTRSVALISFVLVISSVIGSSDERAHSMRPSKVVTYFPQAHGTRAQGMSIQPDGKIVVVGAVEDANHLDFEWGLVRYKPDLSLDETFGIGGHVRTDVSGFASRDYLDYVMTPNTPGSPIVVAGRTGSVVGPPSPEQAALARYVSTTGVLDGSFGTDGTGIVKITGRGIEPHRVTALAVQSDGRIVVAGYGSVPNYADRRGLQVSLPASGQTALRTIFSAPRASVSFRSQPPISQESHSNRTTRSSSLLFRAVISLSCVSTALMGHPIRRLAAEAVQP